MTNKFCLFDYKIVGRILNCCKPLADVQRYSMILKSKSIDHILLISN